MVREKKGKILFVEDKCYLRIGFESEDGKFEEKMISAQELTSFIDTFDLDKRCVDIKEAHKKLDDIKRIDKCDYPKLEKND